MAEQLNQTNSEDRIDVTDLINNAEKENSADAPTQEQWDILVGNANQIVEKFTNRTLELGLEYSEQEFHIVQKIIGAGTRVLRSLNSLNTAIDRHGEFESEREFYVLREQIGDSNGWSIERIGDDQYRLAKDATNPVEATSEQMLQIAPVLVGDADLVERMFAAAKLQPVKKRKNKGSGDGAASYANGRISVPNAKTVQTHRDDILDIIRMMRANGKKDAEIEKVLAKRGFGTRNGTSINPGQIGNLRKAHEIA